MVPIRPDLQENHLVPLRYFYADLAQHLIDMLAEDDPSIFRRTYHMIEQHRNIVTPMKILAFCQSPPLSKVLERSKLRRMYPQRFKKLFTM